MTDFKNLTTTTQYAIEGFYKYLYQFIPHEYRIQYKHNEAVDCYGEFYDQELTFENRLKYKATKIEYVDRRSPWIALMWNSEGMQPAENHFRKFPVKIATEDGRYHKAQACYVRLPMLIAAVSNTRTALDELQEVFWLNVRPDDCTVSAEHPIIKDFNINITNFNFSATNKLPRDNSTLAMSTITADIQYPIVGCVDDTTGIIQTINVYVHNMKSTILSKFSI